MTLEIGGRWDHCRASRYDGDRGDVEGRRCCGAASQLLYPRFCWRRRSGQACPCRRRHRARQFVRGYTVDQRDQPRVRVDSEHGSRACRPRCRACVRVASAGRFEGRAVPGSVRAFVIQPSDLQQQPGVNASEDSALVVARHDQTLGGPRIDPWIARSVCSLFWRGRLACASARAPCQGEPSSRLGCVCQRTCARGEGR